MPSDFKSISRTCAQHGYCKIKRRFCRQLQGITFLCASQHVIFMKAIKGGQQSPLTAPDASAMSPRSSSARSAYPRSARYSPPATSNSAYSLCRTGSARTHNLQVQEHRVHARLTTKPKTTLRLLHTLRETYHARRRDAEQQQKVSHNSDATSAQQSPDPSTKLTPSPSAYPREPKKGHGRARPTGRP